MAYKVDSLHLRWRVFNPFPPGRNIETTFYHRSEDATLMPQTRWKMSISASGTEPNPPFQPYFFFSLECFHPGEMELDIVAKDLSVRIVAQKGREETEIVVFNGDFIFRRSRSFQRLVGRRNGRCNFLVDVKMSLGYGEFQRWRPPAFIQDDLSQLSEDMSELYEQGLHYDMSFGIKDTQLYETAHSFLIKERWNNLAQMHNLQRLDESHLETGIHADVLREILYYMYSSQMSRKFSELDEETTTELLQVMDFYELQNFYQTFIGGNKPVHVRITRYGIRETEHIFKLPLRKDLFFLFCEPMPAVRVNYRVEFFMDRPNPEFSYSLKFRTRFALDARVTLDYFQDSTKLRTPLYEGEFRVDPFDCELYETDFPMRSNSPVWMSFRRGGRRMKHSFRFTVYLARYGESLNIESEADENLAAPTNLEGGHILSTDMYRVFCFERAKDLRVVCRSMDSSSKTSFALHKAIFAFRVPNWRAVLKCTGEAGGNANIAPEGAAGRAGSTNVALGREGERSVNIDEKCIGRIATRPKTGIPDEVECILSGDAFPYVRNYIYTAKTRRIPHNLLDEIQNFAERGEFTALKNLVNRMREDYYAGNR